MAPTSDLEGALAGARPGDSFCLAPGRYSGPLVVPAGVSLWGPRDAVVATRGTGDTVRLVGAGAALFGVTVDGSGGRFDLQEAAVHIVAADDARLEGVEIVHALFGVIVEQSRRVTVRGNEIRGGSGPTIGLRGDAVRIWETTDSRIESNRITGSRDMVIWYSSRNIVADNEVRDGRYGTHFMYSHGNRVQRNRYVGNVVGVFSMYSRDLELEENLLAASTGAAGMGLGVKESSGLRIRRNVFVDNTVGLFLDNSPDQPGTENLFVGNQFRLCDTAVAFHASTRSNRFLSNTLRGNVTQVRVDGGGDALGNEWLGNDFDDYAGYDLDRDGVGDLPYELRSLTDTLVARHPQLDYFRGAPALAILEAASRLLPIYRPKTVLVDARPGFGRALPGAPDAN